MAWASRRSRRPSRASTPLPGAEGLPRRAARHDPGRHHQRHVHPVRPAPHGEAGHGRRCSATSWRWLTTAPSRAFRMRCPESKLTTVRALQSCGFDTIAAGDSHKRPGDDQSQLRRASCSSSPDSIKAENTDLPAFEEYDDPARRRQAGLWLNCVRRRLRHRRFRAGARRRRRAASPRRSTKRSWRRRAQYGLERVRVVAAAGFVAHDLDEAAQGEPHYHHGFAAQTRFIDMEQVEPGMHDQVLQRGHKLARSVLADDQKGTVDPLFQVGLRSKAFASISSMPFEGPPFISNMRAISRGSMLSSACAASAPKPSKW